MKFVRTCLAHRAFSPVRALFIVGIISTMHGFVFTPVVCCVLIIVWICYTRVFEKI